MSILPKLVQKQKKRFSANRARKFRKWFAKNHHAYLFLNEANTTERERLSCDFDYHTLGEIHELIQAKKRK